MPCYYVQQGLVTSWASIIDFLVTQDQIKLMEE